MGTRSIICIVKDGAYKLAKYCQWDGYPTGVGAGIANYLRQEGFLDQLKEKCDLLYDMTDEEERAAWRSIGVDIVASGGSVRLDDYSRFTARYPQISRDKSYEILALIVTASKPIGVRNDLDFAANSLFCEWGYVIDFDKEIFEIYRGFNERPLTENDRFYFLAEKEREGGAEWHGIRKCTEYGLDSIPTFEVLKDLEERRWD